MPRPCHAKHTEPVVDCNRCRLFLTSDFHNRIWGGPGLGAKASTAPVRLDVLPDGADVCRNLGGDTGQLVACKSCGGGKKTTLRLYSCAVYGTCVLGKKQSGVAGCERGRCPGYERKPD